MENNEINFRNRKFLPLDKEVLDNAIEVLNKNKCYYYTKEYILKLSKNDRD